MVPVLLLVALPEQVLPCVLFLLVVLLGVVSRLWLLGVGLVVCRGLIALAVFLV